LCSATSSEALAGSSPNDPLPAGGQAAGKGSCAAPDVEDRASAELLDEVDIRVEVAPVVVDEVVDGCQARMTEDRIRHDYMIGQAASVERRP
jgi:hypothetical protein